MAINRVKLARENQMKPLKYQGSKGKANGISFWAYLLPICIFISILYVFKLSPPSSLLNTTKFWFFVSNTLILIIAADFGASKKQAEIHDDCVEKTIGNISFPTFESRYPEKETVKTSNIPPPMVNNLEETQEEVKEVVTVDEARESESEENKEQVVAEDDVKESIEGPEEKMVEFTPNVDREEAHEEEKEREKSIANEPNEKQQRGGGGGDDDDEFSKMSNEELNRRAEEFIQKFSRQIRLQAAQNKIRQVQRGNLVY